MCTVSWIHQPGGLTLLFSRDERRDRPAGHPPERVEVGGIHALAPRDRKAGGTSIFVNEAGCVGALLNHYPAPGQLPTNSGSEYTSRGALLRDLIPCTSPDRVGERLKGILCSGRFQPFHLLFFSPCNGEVQWTWSGERLNGPSRPSAPVTTSSWNSEVVEAFRRSDFQRRVETRGALFSSADLKAYHLDRQFPERASSVLMDRADVCTVSLCRVDIDDHRVQMSYRRRLTGNRFAPSERIVLPRVKGKNRG